MAEGHTTTFNTTEDCLPDLPRCKLTQQQVLSKSRQHTLSAPGAGVFDSKSPGSSRCSSPRLRRVRMYNGYKIIKIRVLLLIYIHPYMYSHLI